MRPSGWKLIVPLIETLSQLDSHPWIRSRTFGSALLVILLFAGCAASIPPSPSGPSIESRQAPTPAPELTSRAEYLMGTICTISVPTEDAGTIPSTFDQITRIESLLSTWKDESDLARLNADRSGEPVTVPPELFDLLLEAVGWSDRTDGAFNPLVAPLVRIWKVRGAGRYPGPLEIEEVRPLLRVNRIDFFPKSHSIRLDPGAGFEEGGFGKGYAIDQALKSLRAAGVGAAMVDFGGQIALSGFPAPIEIAIANPEARTQPALRLTLNAGSIATTSGSEHHFTVQGRTFSHILDPRTGLALPPRGSVSVIRSSALEADILSTALYVMGPEAGLRWADAHDVEAVFITPEGDGTWSVRTSTPFRQQTRDLRPVDETFTERN